AVAIAIAIAIAVTIAIAVAIAIAIAIAITVPIAAGFLLAVAGRITLAGEEGREHHREHDASHRARWARRTGVGRVDFVAEVHCEVGVDLGRCHRAAIRSRTAKIGGGKDAPPMCGRAKSAHVGRQPRRGRTLARLSRLARVTAARSAIRMGPDSWRPFGSATCTGPTRSRRSNSFASSWGSGGAMPRKWSRLAG